MSNIPVVGWLPIRFFSIKFLWAFNSTTMTSYGYLSPPLFLQRFVNFTAIQPILQCSTQVCGSDSPCWNTCNLHLHNWVAGAYLKISLVKPLSIKVVTKWLNSQHYFRYYRALLAAQYRLPGSSSYWRELFSNISRCVILQTTNPLFQVMLVNYALLNNYY